MATRQFFSALNNINTLLHECRHFENILLLTVNLYGRVIIHFDRDVTLHQIKALMAELHIADYEAAYSDTYYCNYVSFKYGELPGE
jgi:hypothetical protein